MHILKSSLIVLALFFITLCGLGIWRHATIIPVRALTWPDTSSTGVPHGTVLTPMSCNNGGPITITADNTTIDSRLVSGCGVIIAAANVTIKNSKIQDNQGDYAVIQVKDTATNALIEDSEIDGQNVCSGGGCYGIGWHNFRVLRVYIHNTTDGVNVESNDVVQDSYLANPYDGDSKAHPDGIQSTGGSSVLVQHNHITWGDNSCAIFKTDQGPIDNMTFEDNLCDGTGHYLFYNLQGQAQYGVPTNVTLASNVFGRGYQYGVADKQGSVVAYCNIWQDNGQLINASDPGGFAQSANSCSSNPTTSSNTQTTPSTSGSSAQPNKSQPNNNKTTPTSKPSGNSNTNTTTSNPTNTSSAQPGKTIAQSSSRHSSIKHTVLVIAGISLSILALGGAGFGFFYYYYLPRHRKKQLTDFRDGPIIVGPNSGRTR